MRAEETADREPVIRGATAPKSLRKGMSGVDRRYWYKGSDMELVVSLLNCLRVVNLQESEKVT